jgi:hypothetical protein
MKTTHRIAAASLLLFNNRNSTPTVTSIAVINTAPVIGVPADVTPAVYSSGVSDTERWEMADTAAGPWTTVDDMLTIDAAYTDQTFGKVVRWYEAQGAVVAASAATGAVKYSAVGLVAFWELEEASGQRNDTHGTNHLTDNNTVTQAAGKVGNAAQFTAANNESLSIADNAALSVGDIAFTVWGWCYLDSLGVQRVMLCKGSGNSAATSEYRVAVNASNAVTFSVSDGATLTTKTVSVFGALAASTWYFIECYHDPAADVIGIRINNNTAETAAHSVGVQDGAGNVRLGTRPAGDSDFWNGRLDQWGIAKRLLTSGERAAHYNGGAGRAYDDVYA